MTLRCIAPASIGPGLNLPYGHEFIALPWAEMPRGKTYVNVPDGACSTDALDLAVTDSEHWEVAQ